MKRITFVDALGYYWVATPAYNDLARPSDETDDNFMERFWLTLVKNEKYGIDQYHPKHIVEDSTLRARWAECEGTYFRYGATSGLPVDGAWEMDTDGTPKVNMAKARGVHMDKIRVVRDAELVKKDLVSLRAIEAGDASAQSTITTEKQTLRDIPQTFDLTTVTPIQLRNKWPSELPARE